MSKILAFLFLPLALFGANIELGVDQFFAHQQPLIAKKRVGLITNHTGVDSNLEPTWKRLHETGRLVALFSPEHGLSGAARAFESIPHSKNKNGVRIYSLHGETRRPTKEMLQGIDLLIFDIQEIGCRSYTYISTLFYAMEEAAKYKIPVIVLDRPNPMGGEIVDGPMMNEKMRYFLGYIDIPYCHGMTVGELALFFNKEYKVGCQLKVIPMKGWKRSMTYQETGLSWIPTSPYIPEPDTPFFYASTGILGALSLTSIGIGYPLPFKVVGAPWMDGQLLAEKLNAQKLPGVCFLPFSYRPFYGKFKNETCSGVKIVITDSKIYRPISVQYMLIGMIKSLYTKEFKERLAKMSDADKVAFSKVNGSEKILDILTKEKYCGWKLLEVDKKERAVFLNKRKAYLLYD